MASDVLMDTMETAFNMILLPLQKYPLPYFDVLNFMKYDEL